MNNKKILHILGLVNTLKQLLNVEHTEPFNLIRFDQNWPVSYYYIKLEKKSSRVRVNQEVCLTAVFTMR